MTLGANKRPRCSSRPCVAFVSIIPQPSLLLLSSSFVYSSQRACCSQSVYTVYKKYGYTEKHNSRKVGVEIQKIKKFSTERYESTGFLQYALKNNLGGMKFCNILHFIKFPEYYSFGFGSCRFIYFSSLILSKFRIRISN